MPAVSTKSIYQAAPNVNPIFTLCFQRFHETPAKTPEIPFVMWLTNHLFSMLIRLDAQGYTPSAPSCRHVAVFIGLCRLLPVMLGLRPDPAVYVCLHR